MPPLSQRMIRELEWHRRSVKTVGRLSAGRRRIGPACGPAALNAFMRHTSAETPRKHYQNGHRIAGGVVDDMYVSEVTVGGR